MVLPLDSLQQSGVHADVSTDQYLMFQREVKAFCMGSFLKVISHNSKRGRGALQ